MTVPAEVSLGGQNSVECRAGEILPRASVVERLSGPGSFLKQIERAR